MPRTTDAPTAADLAAIIATHDDPNPFPGVWKRREAVLLAEIVALRAELAEARPVVAAARALDAAWLDERAHEAEYRALTEAIDAIDWTTFRLRPPGRRPAARDGGVEGEG